MKRAPVDDSSKDAPAGTRESAVSAAAALASTTPNLKGLIREMSSARAHLVSPRTIIPQSMRNRAS
jgi:hypothetical protein